MDTPTLFERLFRRRAIALALYLVLAVASFYPQSIRPRDTIAYVGDSLESVYLVAWNVHQFFRAPANLFEANLLYPARHALAFTDHRLLPSLVVAPVIWATGNAVLAYNIAVLLACLLAAMAARHLARALGLHALSAWVAGALYAFHTYQINEAARLNIIFHGFIPLAVAEMIALVRTGRRRHAWRLALIVCLQGLSSNYHLLYSVLLLSVLAVIALIFARREALARLALLIAPAAATLILLAPLLYPYVRVAREHAFTRELPEGVDLSHYVSTAPTNLVYGAIGAKVRMQQKGPHFVGFLTLALACAALLVKRASERVNAALLPQCVWQPLAALLAALFVALSLGKDMLIGGHRLGPGPYRLLYDFVPGFTLVRIPERFALIAMLFIALLAASALDRLILRGGRAAWLALALALLMPAEHLATLPLAEDLREGESPRYGAVIPVGQRVPRIYGWLAAQDMQAVAEVPTHGEGFVRRETLETYFSTYHWQPIIHGYTAYPPLISRILRRAADDFPSEISLQVFERIGVDLVVAHLGRAGSAQLEERLRAAVARGRIDREARFEGRAGRVYQGTADEAYRLRASRAWLAAPLPRGQRLLDPAWRYSAKAGDPLPAADGDLNTAWRVARPLKGDEYFEVVFDRPLAVSGVVIPLARDSVFPTVFRVAGCEPDGRWIERGRLDGPHLLQIVDQLRRSSRGALLGFDLGDRRLTAVRLLVAPDATSFDGWSLPEVEIWVK